MTTDCFRKCVAQVCSFDHVTYSMSFCLIPAWYFSSYAVNYMGTDSQLVTPIGAISSRTCQQDSLLLHADISLPNCKSHLTTVPMGSRDFLLFPQRISMEDNSSIAPSVTWITVSLVQIYSNNSVICCHASIVVLILKHLQAAGDCFQYQLLQVRLILCI